MEAPKERSDGVDQPAGREDEPRLRYVPLGTEGAAAPAASPATRLSASDKVLAVGHRDGSVTLLDHLGNQVKAFKEHSREVTDLGFDDEAEFLASASADGTIAVYGLYTEEVQRLKVGHPVTAVALDPRYATRKTRELVYGTAAGSLVLSSKGWLGAKETVLYAGKGAVHCARMSGALLAWATDSGIRVYDTTSHTRLGKLERPASASVAPGARDPCSMLWRGERELFIAWGRQVTVVRVMGSLLPGAAPPSGSHTASSAAKRSLQIMASFDVGCSVLGAASFGADIAALTWGTPSGGSSTSGGPAIVDASTTADELPVSSPAGGQPVPESGSSSSSPAQAGASPAAAQQPTEQQEQQPQQPTGQQEQQLGLCFFTRAGQLLAVDTLPASCPAAERRWHQLALLYPGDADLQLVAAACGRLTGQQHMASPSRGSAGGSAGGSAAASGRSSPVKPAAATPAPESPRADGGVGTPLPAAEALQQPAAQQYKWWRDGEEPMYLISGPEGILVGRPRDGNDRVAWLVERGRYAEALAVAEEDSTVAAPVRESTGEQLMQSLVGEGQYSQASALAPRVLKDNALAWERWTYVFAQERQLAALAPVLPTDEPRLKGSTYDMVLAALLLNPAEHEVLLDVVRRWPQSAYDAARLQAAVLERMGSSGGEWPALQQVAAHLYMAQGRHEEALKLMIRLKSPAVFDYIARHALIDRLPPFAADLIGLDEVRATSLFVEHFEEVPPQAVVEALQGAIVAAGSDQEQRQRWRRRLHHYLDWLFQKDSQQGAAFAELQVELYAEFEPARLLHFLMVSPAYPLEHAYQVCEQRGLVREMVFVLGRMGSAEKALRLIVEGLRDVAQAVEFVQLQRDDDLWEQLIALTLGDAQLTGSLLDHAGGYIDPLRLVSQIPKDMQVENLRGRLVKIITDFRTQMCLQQGCNTILRHDCIVLANRLYRILRSSLRQLHLRQQQGGSAKWVLYDTRRGEEPVQDDAAAALLAGPDMPGEAAAGESPGPTVADSGSSTSPQQQRQRVWVGFIGGPPPAPASTPLGDGQLQQHVTRSPSKFASLSPARSPGPRKVLVS